MSVSDLMLEQLRDDGLLSSARPVIVLLSGGRDSTCLLDLVVRLSGAERTRALHVNYGLRDTADRDAQHCEALCERLRVELHVRLPAAAPHGNVQAWARRERYRAAHSLAARCVATTPADGGGRAPGAAVIASGHTATDQLETILYRLISSPSRRALLGMRARDTVPDPAGAGDGAPAITLIRPLLGHTREQTGAYCRERGLTWVDDETNATGKYVRNRIRNELLPLITELHPGAERNILALARTLADEQALLDTLVEAELTDAAGQPRTSIALARLHALQPALARLVVQRLADSVNDAPAPGAATRLPEILALSPTGTSHLDLPHRIRATVSDGLLSFTATDPKSRDHRKLPADGE